MESSARKESDHRLSGGTAELRALPKMRGNDVGVAGLASNYIRREDQLEVFLLPVLRRNRLYSAELVRIGEELARCQGAEDRKTGGGDDHLFGPWVENAHHEGVVAG